MTDNISISTPTTRARRPLRRFLTKRDLQDRYRWKTPLSIDRAWRLYGTLPPPTLYQGRRPLWAEDILDQHDADHRFVEDEA
jgi:hypothetical protein